ncbi:hypothetical protein FA95DRAFT_153602 [Auriscalpium vulgare]|uniref:Uncharacterized protein n=1 Tax=Auriscalpium vulgare TaxID=40419 RepID=A0ACB8RNL9_9AGAM|nr:hypothetical protein FA95DRAFT_153602 [Auriscalpium vulgare]
MTVKTISEMYPLSPRTCTPRTHPSVSLRHPSPCIVCPVPFPFAARPHVSLPVTVRHPPHLDHPTPFNASVSFCPPATPSLCTFLSLIQPPRIPFTRLRPRSLLRIFPTATTLLCYLRFKLSSSFWTPPARLPFVSSDTFRFPTVILSPFSFRPLLCRASALLPAIPPISPRTPSSHTTHPPSPPARTYILHTTDIVP